MQSGQLFKTNEIARRAPNFVSTRDERLRDGKANSGARSRYKDFLHRCVSDRFYSKVKVRRRHLHELFSREWMSILLWQLTFFPSRQLRRLVEISFSSSSARSASLFSLYLPLPVGLPWRYQREFSPRRTSCLQRNEHAKCF